MQQESNRWKLRQEYLAKRREAFRKWTQLTVFVLLTPLIIWLGWITRHKHFFWPLDIIFLWLALPSACYAAWLEARKARRIAQRAYVPPVTSETLSADEILVRGSQEPAIAQKEVLLRTAHVQETAPEELLRISQE
jgi:hypothetical protein